MTISCALRGHIKFCQGVGGVEEREEWCAGSECSVDIDCLVFCRGDRRFISICLKNYIQKAKRVIIGLPASEKHHLNVILPVGVGCNDIPTLIAG